jgi:hypothetical protein
MLSQCGKSNGFKLLRLRKTLSRPPALNRTIYPGYDGRDDRKSCQLFLLAALLFRSLHHAMLLDDFEQIPWQDREGLLTVFVFLHFKPWSLVYGICTLEIGQNQHRVT